MDIGRVEAGGGEAVKLLPRCTHRGMMSIMGSSNYIMLPVCHECGKIMSVRLGLTWHEVRELFRNTRQVFNAGSVWPTERNR